MDSVPVSQPVPNKSKLRRRLTVIIVICIAALFLYLAFKDVDFVVMWNTVQTAHYEILIVVFLISSASLFLRSLRWRLLLTSEKPIKALTVFWCNNAGYFGNYFLPARAGELVRAAAVGQAGNIGVSFSLATALTERILDAIILVLVSLVAIFSYPDLPDILITATRTMAVAGVFGLLGVIFAPRMEKQIKWIIERIPMPGKVKPAIHTFMERFLLGMRSLQNPGRLFGFLGFSVVIWSLDAVCAILVGLAYNFSISIALAFIILAALGLSSAIPSTPGYVGVFQFVAVAVMTPFGYRASDALVFIITWQAAAYVLIAIWGGLSIWQLGLRKNLFNNGGTIKS